MQVMSKIDFHQLDGQILRTFLVILDESSVSRAASRLGVTQSAVSHTLAKLREILGDPLFVRSGQGLTPTATALALKDPAREVLDGMKRLTDRRDFDPLREPMHFVVAANDMQRDLVFPALALDAHEAGVAVSFEFKPSGVPSAALLRDAQCDLVLSPLPPDAPDMVQQKLFSGDMRCFYDPEQTEPPATLEAYLAAQHVSVQFALGGASNDVLSAPALPRLPRPTIAVSNFAGITPFIKGTQRITTQFELMRLTVLRELADAPLPFAADGLSVFMIWHERSHNDPAHQWLRDNVRRVSRPFDS